MDSTNILSNQNLYKEMLDKIDTGIYFVDANRTLIFWNKGAENITGFTKAEIMGKYCFNNILNHIDENGIPLCKEGCPLEATMRDGRERSEIVYLHHKLGHRVRIRVKASAIYDDNKIVGCVEMFERCVESNLKRNIDCITTGNISSEELKIFALHDQLTGLPNRHYLDSILKSKFMEFELLDLPFGILFLDIDHFRDFNNNYGHALGDKVLKTISETLLSSIRKTDFIGRWGGEEFIGIFPMVPEKELGIIAEKIRFLIENSILREEDGKEFYITVSVGGTLAKKGDSLESLINRADKQMYLSKNNGRNQVTIG